MKSSSSIADGAIIGFARFADGLGRLAISLIDSLSSELSLQAIATRPPFIADLPLSSINAFTRSFSSVPPVSLLIDSPSYSNFFPYKLVPQASAIKLALSVFESTRIPQQWVEILNSEFDAALVFDSFVKQVYLDSGVKIPLLSVPHPLYLEDFFKLKKRKIIKNFFTFGHTSSFFERKNVPLLVKAFEKKFGNNPSIRLRLHCRLLEGHRGVVPTLREIGENLPPNIEIFHESLSHEDYLSFFQSLDCYVTLSKGEGFAVPPREALAMGIPTIVTDNTAQSTLCQTGYVRAIPSPFLEPAVCHLFDCNIGDCFNCSLEEAAAAMQDVYENYNFYFKKAAKATPWLKQHLLKKVKGFYKTLFKPKRVIYGDFDEVTETTLTTTSKSLYEKYLRLL